ncbi:MAG: sporulation protein [Methanobrevibacter sp.]|jgi:uncharacterized spore protein YtfJ|nr:sporulation protein [Candidatus Methanovirga meridionalis]
MGEDVIKDSIEELKNLIKANNFIGDPIETEDKLIIPFMKVGFGFVGVNGNGKNNNGEGFGGGVGIEPVSIVVINKNPGDSDLVQVLSLSEIDTTSKVITDLGIVLADLIKEILANINGSTNSEVADDE